MLREVLVVGLTWRDIASSAIVAAMVIGFVSFEFGTKLVLFSTAWAASAVELSLTDVMSKIVVDDWGQCATGKFGALRAHVEAGKLTAENLHAELGQIVAGLRPGRESDQETILFWHRGLSLSDIALGHALLAKAASLGVGQRLRYA